MSTLRRCGRLDRHEPHEWPGRLTSSFWAFPALTVWFHCPGHVVTEGGHWTRCPGCHTSGSPHRVGGVECREWAREKAISQGDV